MRAHDVPYFAVTNEGIGVYAVDAQSQHRHLAANVKDEGYHDAVGGGLSETADKHEGKLQGVRDHVGAQVLHRVEQMKAIGQQIDHPSYVFADRNSRQTWRDIPLSHLINSTVKK